MTGNDSDHDDGGSDDDWYSVLASDRLAEANQIMFQRRLK